MFRIHLHPSYSLAPSTNMVCGARLLILLCLVVAGRAEVYTSLVQFTQVLHSEDALATQMQDFIHKEEQRLEELRRIAADYQEHSKMALENVEDYLANPLNAFLLVKRFTSDWQKVTEMIKNEAAQEFIKNVTRSTPVFPDEFDLIGSAKALLRLQDTYALDTGKLAKGEIKGATHVKQLTGDDCFELGRIAYMSFDYYHAILWHQQALELMKAENQDDATIARTLDYLAFAVYNQGNVHAALELTKEWLKYDPHNVRANANIDGYEREIRETAIQEDPTVLKNRRNLRGYRSTREFELYEKLCRGEKTMENPYESQLSCWYNKDHPYFILRPLKQELMYLDPYVTLYHDLITDTEINKIKEIAGPMLHTSVLFKPKDPSTVMLDDVRVSKSAWVHDDHHWLVGRLSQKVQYATGLSVLEAEQMQVLNYGIGGHYEPHHDFSKPNEENKDLPHFRDFGNRISTSLYYMTDVAAGGATVFTDIGVHVAPEKGMMLHWFNLRKSGEGDYKTKHAGCPVLTGTKWVCNKWIHERGQEFRRPCTLNPED